MKQIDDCRFQTVDLENIPPHPFNLQSTIYNLKYNAPGPIRTAGPLLRSEVLYPSELQARGSLISLTLLYVISKGDIP